MASRQNRPVHQEHVRAIRAHAQYLYHKATPADMTNVVRALCGVNAQSYPAMMLSLRARIEGLELADVKKEMEEKRTLVRTWAMRGTIHLIDTSDLGWMVSLLGPAMIKKGAGRRLELGLDDEKTARGLTETRAILNETENLTRKELIKKLIERGIDIDPNSQAPYHLLSLAGLEGFICIGPDSLDGKQTYSLASRWTDIQKPSIRFEPVAELAYRYLNGYGPATPEDFSSWSGLSLHEARKGWNKMREHEILTEIRVEDRILWSIRSRSVPDEPPENSDTVVNLLPAFDPYILGYSDREYLVPTKHKKDVYHGGQTVPVVLVNGQAAGVWRYRRQGKGLKLSISPFEPFDSATKDLIDEESHDIGRFTGLSAFVAYDSPSI